MCALARLRCRGKRINRSFPRQRDRVMPRWIVSGSTYRSEPGPGRQRAIILQPRLDFVKPGLHRLKPAPGGRRCKQCSAGLPDRTGLCRKAKLCNSTICPCPQGYADHTTASLGARLPNLGHTGLKRPLNETGCQPEQLTRVEGSLFCQGSECALLQAFRLSGDGFLAAIRNHLHQGFTAGIHEGIAARLGDPVRPAANTPNGVIAQDQN